MLETHRHSCFISYLEFFSNNLSYGNSLLRFWQLLCVCIVFTKFKNNTLSIIIHASSNYIENVIFFYFLYTAKA